MIWSPREKFAITESASRKSKRRCKAIEFPNVQTVQIIFNCFRQRPADVFFAKAREKQVGILARVPLASGLLTGKLRRDSTFAADDHRNFNRRGEAFDVGETFSGVDYETGLAAVEEIRQLLPAGVSMSQFALRWILMFDAVTCAIPGGKRAEQVADNCQCFGPSGAYAGSNGGGAADLRREDPATGAASLVRMIMEDGVPPVGRATVKHGRDDSSMLSSITMAAHERTLYRRHRDRQQRLHSPGVAARHQSDAAYPRTACRRLACRRGDGSRRYQRSAGGRAGAAGAAVRCRRQLDRVYSGGH